MIKEEFICSNGLFCSYYSSGKSINSEVVVFALGVPSIEAASHFKEAALFVHNDIDVLVPDYYGYLRSEGDFTPENCIKSLQKVVDLCCGDTVKSLSGKEIVLDYANISLLGYSYGGAVVPFVAERCPRVRRIGLAAPALTFSDLGCRGEVEMSVDLFREIMNQGYGNIYCGILTHNRKLWESHFAGASGLLPSAISAYLATLSVFIAHGTEDKQLFHRRSEDFALSLNSLRKDSTHYVSYEGVGHEGCFLEKTITDYIMWLKQGQYNR